MSRLLASYRTNLVLTLLGGWFTIGLFLDAWAHNNVPELESFLTPWHAVFYWGFAATAGWIGWTVRSALRPGQRDIQNIPIGYGPAVVAVIGFAVAGFGDLVWHTAFGIEASIDILFSPTHVGLITAMFVIVTTPVRATWADRSLPAAPGLRRLLPAVLSVAWATTLVLLFLQYANVLTYDSGSVVVALSTMEREFTASIASAMAVTNLVLVVPLLTLARRWVLPFGTATILYAAVGGLSGAVTGFHNVDLLIGFLVTGGLVDLLARWLRLTADRPIRFRAFATLTPLVTWTGFLGTAALLAPPLSVPPGFDGAPAAGVVELYTGMPIVQAVIGLLVAVLLVPYRRARAV